MVAQTAATNRIEKLYHYQSFNPDYLEGIIAANTLYFSKPTDFNDPWDCQAWFCVDGLSDPSTLKRHIDWYITVTRQNIDLPEDEIQRRADYLKSNPLFLRSKIEECSTAITGAVRKDYRVYCLSTKPDSELMWAHYSDKHHGICFEFDTANRFFSPAIKVSYQQNYPTYYLPDEDQDEAPQALITKSMAWNYEDEYRLIARDENATRFHDVLITKNNLTEYPPTALTAVIVGCLAAPSQIDKLRAHLSRATHAISLKQAIPSNNQYKLSIIEL